MVPREDVALPMTRPMPHASGMTTIYDRIGRGYARSRRPDPQIAAAVLSALGDARSVVNVGAGTGSYEPEDREVVAVEPSRAMIRQRHAGAAPAVRAVAEHLPFRDRRFDAAMATLTMHHWKDTRRGIAEMRRVARSRVVVLTFDPSVSHSFWLVRDYLPSISRLETDSFSFSEVAAALGGDVQAVPVPAACTDGFLAAYWRRPEQYLDESIRAGMSAFHGLPPDEVEAGLSRLAADLRNGRWARRNDELLHATEFDGGYRLIVAEL